MTQNGALLGTPPYRGGDANHKGAGGLGPRPLPPSPPATSGMLNFHAYGADFGGASDVSSLLMKALQDSLAPPGMVGYPKLQAPNAGYLLPNQGLYVPPGLYLISNTVDFSKLLSAGSPIANWNVVMDPGAIFIASPALGANPMFNLVPPANTSIEQSFLQFGQLVGNGVTNGIGINTASVADSRIVVYQIFNCAGQGFLINSVGAFAPWGNNQVWLNLLTSNGVGLQTTGTSGSSIGAQGNHFWIGDVIDQTSHGIWIDSTSTSGQVGSTQYNKFVISAAEHNGGYGILDYNGANEWDATTNSNTTAGIGFGNTALAVGHVPIVRGYFWDSVPVVTNGNTINLINASGPIAPQPSTAPVAIAAAITYATQPFQIPANTIKAGTVIVFDLLCSNTATANTVTITPKFGTAGTTADTTVGTALALTAGTAVAGTAKIRVTMAFRSTTSVDVSIEFYNLIGTTTNVTGFAGVPAAGNQSTTAVTTTANMYAGVCLTGTSASVANVQQSNITVIQ